VDLELESRFLKKRKNKQTSKLELRLLKSSSPVPIQVICDLIFRVGIGI
jgi:hypothetical protein